MMSTTKDDDPWDAGCDGINWSDGNELMKLTDTDRNSL